MRLAKAEVKRLAARRFTWIMLLVVAGISAVIVVGVGADSKERTPEVLAAADEQVAEQREAYEREQRRCEEEVAAGSENYPPDFDCAQAYDPSQIDREWFLPTIFSFAEDTGEIVVVVGFMLALLGFAVAASYVGAEWTSGGMANLLLWRPRRLPVLATKLAVVTASVAVVGAALLALIVAAMYVVASVRGDLSGTTAETWRILTLQASRSIALALVTAAVGFALATIGRSTAMALGFSIGYMIVIETGLQIVLAIAEVAFPQRYLLSTYAFAWLQGGTTLQDYSRCETEQAVSSSAQCMPETVTISLADTTIVGGVVLAVFLGVATALFLRRDVT